MPALREAAEAHAGALVALLIACDDSDHEETGEVLSVLEQLRTPALRPCVLDLAAQITHPEHAVNDAGHLHLQVPEDSRGALLSCLNLLGRLAGEEGGRLLWGAPLRWESPEGYSLRENVARLAGMGMGVASVPRSRGSGDESERDDESEDESDDDESGEHGLAVQRAALELLEQVGGYCREAPGVAIVWEPA